MLDVPDQTVEDIIMATRSVVESISRAPKEDEDLDLEIARISGFFDRYATNLDVHPKWIELSVDEAYRKGNRRWDEKPRVGIKVRNEHGGGLIYKDVLPNFSGDISAALKIPPAQAAHLKPGQGMEWKLEVHPDNATALFDIHTDHGYVSGEGRGRTAALAICAAGLVARMHAEMLQIHNKEYQDSVQFRR